MAIRRIVSKYWRLRYFPKTGGGIPIKGSTSVKSDPVKQTPVIQGSVI